MKEWQTKIDTIFDQLINLESTFDIEHIDAAIKKNINSTFFVTPPNIVILEPGEALNKNEHVYRAVNMFLEDFGYTKNGILNLVCDEAIYHRMKDYKSDEQTFFDKLEQVVDYRATFRVLELIWIAVAVAIHLYVKEMNIYINNVPKENNNLLKVWYNFYR
ncbi:12637_t:CDS:2 [Acaulospora colombiana]|uniref:12637_t:CDS:1 n=1 Tax=Acaulospora colombiana TaxID=27376 RepID=A0ACA9KM09_9GLOM|nr:12637_t:CDS:2 [Acaulospora colombiana]